MPPKVNPNMKLQKTVEDPSSESPPKLTYPEANKEDATSPMDTSREILESYLLCEGWLHSNEGGLYLEISWVIMSEVNKVQSDLTTLETWVTDAEKRINNNEEEWSFLKAKTTSTTTSCVEELMREVDSLENRALFQSALGGLVRV